MLRQKHSSLTSDGAQVPVISCLALSVLLLASSFSSAELPLARLTSIFPSGGQSGGKVEVTLTGQDLDGVDRLWFSHPGISAAATSSVGKFLITVDASVPPGLYDVRAVGLFGISNPRSFEVCSGSVVQSKAGNTSADAAVELSVGSSAYGVCEANADHFYRVPTNGLSRLVIDVSAAALDSKMEPITVVSDAAGHELGRSHSDGDPIRIDSPPDGSCFIRIHDLLYRGGAEFFYRVRATGDDVPRPGESGSLRWPFPPAATFLPSLPAQCEAADGQEVPGGQKATRIEVPCEIHGLFRSARQRDSYTFSAAAGSVDWIEIISHRLGQDTSPFFLVQRADRDGKWLDLQEVYPAPAAVAVPEFSLATRDPVYRLEAKEAGTYRLLVRDLFARDRGGHPAPYELVIRHETPDFQLVAVPESPLPGPADSKDVPVWTTLLRRGGTAPIRVIVLRRDGFSGPITLHVDGLPPDVIAGPAIIPEGASTATIVLQAGENAHQWVGPITISGVGHTAAGDFSRVARAGTVSFSEYNAETKTLLLLRSRQSDQFMLAVSGVEAAPISIIPVRDTFEVPAGGKIPIAFDIKSRATFTTPIVLNLAGHPQALKQVAIDPKAEKANVELDLSQTKLPAGRYTLYLVGQAKIKYPDSPDLRAARIAQMQAEARQMAFARQITGPIRAFWNAIKAKDLKQALGRSKPLLLAEMNWVQSQQGSVAATSRASEAAARAPAAERAISVYTGAFELNVFPAATK